jgi:CTP:molybdopterin cytidylyltransferase MocA
VIAGLVLAAGEGRRFGEKSKLLADVCGRPVLERAVSAQIGVDSLERVVVVLGARANELLSAVRFGRAEPVVCAEWADGQAASLRCGVAALAAAERVVVTLGDQPLMLPELVALFAHEEPPARAVYSGMPGHPVVLGRDQLQAVAGLRGHRGARDLLHGCREIDCSAHGNASRDVDTARDLQAVRDEVGAARL